MFQLQIRVIYLFNLGKWGQVPMHDATFIFSY